MNIISRFSHGYKEAPPHLMDVENNTQKYFQYIYL